MATRSIDTKFYYEEDSISEKIREDLIRLFRSSVNSISDDCLKLKFFQERRNEFFWLKGEANNSKIIEELEKMKKEGLINWDEKDNSSQDCIIKFTEKGKLKFFG